MLHKEIFLINIIVYHGTLDLIKCLKQIKLQILLLKYAPIFELPSNISTNAWIVKNDIDRVKSLQNWSFVDEALKNFSYPGNHRAGSEKN